GRPHRPRRRPRRPRRATRATADRGRRRTRPDRRGVARRPHRGVGTLLRVGATMLGMNAQEQANLDLVLEYLEKFGTFDPEQYDPYLIEEPTYMAGMNI